MDDILKNLPKYNDIRLDEDIINEADSLISIKKDMFANHLSNWQKITLDVIETINKNEFSLKDIYEYEHIFSSNFPYNNTIRDSIRKKLQELRDLGLIEFMGDGKYKKLWN